MLGIDDKYTNYIEMPIVLGQRSRVDLSDEGLDAEKRASDVLHAVHLHIQLVWCVAKSTH